MFKKFSKIILSIVLFISFQNSAHAASLSISASSRNVIVGSNVTVTIKASDLAGTFNIKSSNSSVLSGGASNSWIENGSVTYPISQPLVNTKLVNQLLSTYQNPLIIAKIII